MKRPIAKAEEVARARRPQRSALAVEDPGWCRKGGVGNGRSVMSCVDVGTAAGERQCRGTGRDGTGRDGTGRDGTGRDGTGRDGRRRV